MTTTSDHLIRTTSADILDVTTTALSRDVRLQVWDGLRLSTEEPLRTADIRMSTAQARRLVAELQIAIDAAVTGRMRDMLP